MRDVRFLQCTAYLLLIQKRLPREFHKTFHITEDGEKALLLSRLILWFTLRFSPFFSNVQKRKNKSFYAWLLSAKSVILPRKMRGSSTQNTWLFHAKCVALPRKMRGSSTQNAWLFHATL